MKLFVLAFFAAGVAAEKQRVTVQKGDCPYDGDTVESPTEGSSYPNDDSCVIKVNEDVLATVNHFRTEFGYDTLTASGHVQPLSGYIRDGTQMYIEEGSTIKWKSDYYLQSGSGWSISFDSLPRVDGFKIKDGSCKPDEPGTNCIVSPNYPDSYTDAGCSIEVLQDGSLSLDGTIIDEHDHLIVGGGGRIPFQDGDGSPVTVRRGETIKWVRKGSSSGGKWTLCMDPHSTAEEVVSMGGMAALSFTIMMMLSVFIWDRFWRKKMDARDHQSQVFQVDDDFKKHVHMHMLPGSSATGSYKFRGLTTKEEQVALKFEDLGLDLKNGTNVLQGVTGGFGAGRMVAIMGPSGAGKTTFMNVLCGKATYGTMRGDVKINGESKSIQSLKPIMGFVPQDDIVHEKLTVRENIDFSAYLRNPQAKEKAHNMVCEDVLCVMQVRHIQRSIVGGVEARGISGGQRKRVNIGLEVAADPSLLFLDEPTSGLDATSSLTIIDALRQMTDLGTTIIMVIHQPRYSLFTLFDDVLLLGRGGRTVYLGPSTGALPYFEMKGFQMAPRENPADWFMDIISGEITCSKKNDFKPSDLVKFWLDTPAGSLPQGQAEGSGGDKQGPDAGKLEKRFIRHLEDEWSKIPRAVLGGYMKTFVKPGDGSITLEQLKTLLDKCSGGAPYNAGMLDTILGGKKECTKEMFLEFFRGTTVEDGDLANARSQMLSMGDTSGSSTRRRPNVFQQFRLIWRRRLIQIYRNTERRVVDVGLIVVCAVILGALHNNKNRVDLPKLAPQLMILHLGLALMIAVSCTKVFSADRPVFWRESASGINVLAFFMARTLADLFDLITQVVVFTVVYYQIAWPMFPHVHFWDYFYPCALVGLVASGWGYFVSTVVPPESVIMGATIVILIFSGILGNPDQMGDFLQTMSGDIATSLSISRWSVQLTFFATLNQAREEGLEISPLLTDLEDSYEKSIHGKDVSIKIMLGMAIVLRFLAFLGLKYNHRDKQV